MTLVRTDGDNGAVDGDLCNWVDNVITLTANEPTHGSALTGDPKGVSPFTVLGLRCPDTDSLNPGGRRLRGYVPAIRNVERRSDKVKTA